MYYNSNSAVLSQSMIWDTDRRRSVATYILNGLFEKFENAFWLDTGIKSNVVGYNREKYEQLEKLYSMVYTGIQSLEKNYVTASAALDEIAKLDDDWNRNGAIPFPAQLIEKCRGILMQLAAEPFICPTACGSIQFEYEKENGEYLEFEIYEDRIEAFSDTLSVGEEEFVFQGVSATDKMKQMVVDFYG